MDLVEIQGDRLILNLHPGQQKAWESESRFVAMLAGTQGGKTSFAPHWLMREMARRGAGDYLVVGPSFQLLDKKCIPEFRRVFERLLGIGYYVASPGHILHITDDGARRLFGETYQPARDSETRILFGYAADPESLESATAKAAVLDEAGQKKFKLGAWQAILRRLALNRGRALIATSLYAMNWLKTEIFDKFRAGDQDYDVVQFDSIANPNYPREEYERAKRDLPRWLFEMLFRGRFERPAGLIYDCFDTLRHWLPRFAIPRNWKRYIGLDFGPVNTAAVVIVEEPKTRKRYVERTYKPGRRTVREHVAELKRLCPNPVAVVGGSHSEEEWREDFRLAGLAVREPPVRDVEVGIQRTYSEFVNDRLFVFDDLGDLREELTTYGRKLDDSGVPMDEIEDKSDYHLLDALRYIMSQLAGGARAVAVGSKPKTETVMADRSSF